MRIAAKAGVGAVLALAGLTGALVPAGSAHADSCTITRFGHKGKYLCGTNYRAGAADWNHDRKVDEYFVIAPNRTIWHIWANSGGWKEMPNRGRADDIEGWVKDGTTRIVYVKVFKPRLRYYQSQFYDGSWHRWTQAG
ncbi:hypothetical protein RB200_41280 [Streptomyces sp. PmtG]